MQRLDGVVDLHVHTGPDHVSRCVDDISLAHVCAEAGMRAAVIKSHHEPTAARAEIAMRHATPCAPVQLFGSLTLNHAVGGLNAAAVRAMAKVEGQRGRIVWLPTLDAANDHAMKVKTDASRTAGGITVANDGTLHPNLGDVLVAILDHDLVLATGHVSPVEGLTVLKAARQLGIKKLMATHVSSDLTRYTPDQMARAADLGAKLELCALNAYQAGAREGRPGEMSEAWLEDFARVMERVGLDCFVLSSDFGRADLPAPPTGLAAFVNGLEAAGIPEAALRAMVVDTPCRLLGFSQQP
jgi:hypothetical protein